MYEFTKTLHLLFLLLGASAGIGNVALAMALKGAEGTPPNWVPKLRLRFARLGLVSVLTLWFTGLYLLFAYYGGWQPGLSFNLKMVTASLLLLGIVAINLLLNRVRKTGVPNPLIPKLGIATVGLTMLTVIFAIYSFSN